MISKIDFTNPKHEKAIKNIVASVFLNKFTFENTKDGFTLNVLLEDSFRELIKSNFFSIQTPEKKEEYFVNYEKLKKLLKSTHHMGELFKEGFDNL